MSVSWWPRRCRWLEEQVLQSTQSPSSEVMWLDRNPMQIGVVYPQTELPTDPDTVRTCVRRVEELGYQHIEVYDHVLGADPAVHAGWKGPYDVDTTFHEPLVFFGFLAAITTLKLVTGIVIAPQRQTALLAKQAAEVDILTSGRFRLGIGVGWDPVEYEALGQDLSTRGHR